MSENNNEIEVIDEPIIQEIVSGVIKHRDGNKQDIFYLYMFFGLPIKTCAKLAGYQLNYAYKLVQKYKHNAITRERLSEITNLFPEQYKSICKLRLAEMADIEGAALNEYRRDPKLAIDRPALLKQIKQGAGVLTDDAIPGAQMVNIEKLMVLQNIMRGGDLPNKVE